MQPPTIDPTELRAELGRRRWSLRYLAKQSGLSESYIRWVARGAIPHPGAARKILLALGEDSARRVAVGEGRG